MDVAFAANRFGVAQALGDALDGLDDIPLGLGLRINVLDPRADADDVADLNAGGLLTLVS